LAWNKWQKQTIAIAQQWAEARGYSREQMYDHLSEMADRRITTRTDPALQPQHFAEMLKIYKKMGWAGFTERSLEWMTNEQEQRLRNLWALASTAQDQDAALAEFLRIRFGVNELRWVKRERAQGIIDAVKDMAVRRVLQSIAGAAQTGNALLESFRLICSTMTHEEAAALLTAQMADENTRETIYQNYKQLKTNQFQKIIGG